MIPSGQTASSACGGESGAMGDDAAAYCPADDTIYISEQFATNIYTGALDRNLPGSAHGYGGTAGDFAVAYIVAHEYGHQIQHELGVFDREPPPWPSNSRPTATRATGPERLRRPASRRRRPPEALDAALAVGDFDTSNPGHHGTPDQRREAWTTGFEAGDPATCGRYLDA